MPGLTETCLRRPLLIAAADTPSVLPAVPASFGSATAVFTRNLEIFQLTRDTATATATTWTLARIAPRAHLRLLCERLRGDIAIIAEVSRVARPNRSFQNASLPAGPEYHHQDPAARLTRRATLVSPNRNR